MQGWSNGYNRYVGYPFAAGRHAMLESHLVNNPATATAGRQWQALFSYGVHTPRAGVLF